MKFQSLIRILVLMMAVFTLIPAVHAQKQADNSNQAPAQKSAEPLGEDESIPFMQTEKPDQRSDVSTGGLLVKTFGAMLLIVGLIFFGAWGLKKVGFNGLKKNPDAGVPDLSVLSSVSLGTNRTLSVVKFGERVLLVGSTAQSFTLLADKSDLHNEPILEENVSNSQPRSVAEMLAQESSFEKDFIDAQKRMNLFEEKGGQI